MNYHNITTDDMNNGEGLRVVLWLSGCNHHCKGCQNTQTWDENSGIKFDISAKNEIFEELSKDYISGITFSGGDPLHENNLEKVLMLVNQIRLLFPTKTIWLYTGYTWENIMYSRMPHPPKYTAKEFLQWNQRNEIVSSIDVLVDGRYEEDKRDVLLHWRGSSNQRVIDVKESLKQDKIVLYDT
jgi:anaerobic ribonucleoside-triphosphate reductase activating protein